MGSPQVAHIFPYSMLNEPSNPSPAKRTPDFWGLLENFWDADRIARWKREIFPDPHDPKTGVDGCFKLICLRADIHSLWNKGFFALKPLELSNDRKKLTVQFFWQPQYNHRLADCIDLLKEPASSKGLNEVKRLEILPNGTRTEKPYYLSTHQGQIQSEDIFCLTTDDPEIRPLPSWHLLEMQWFLQRLTAMSGAGVQNLDLGDDDDTVSGVLVPGGNHGKNWSYYNVYEWIEPPPPLLDSVPDMAKPATELRCKLHPENSKSTCGRCAKNPKKRNAGRVFNRTQLEVFA